MTITDNLPNLSKSFEKLKLILDLEQKANQKTIMGKAILSAIQAKQTPYDEILEFVKDQAEDSFKTMAECIGVELTKRILNYRPY